MGSSFISGHPLSLAGIDDPNHALGSGMDVDVPNLHRLPVPSPVLVKGSDHVELKPKQLERVGDDTAWRLGRVSFNPLVHIDPFGTVVLPVMLLMLRSPFMFGYGRRPNTLADREHLTTLFGTSKSGGNNGS
jgi:hypothetical protein